MAIITTIFLLNFIIFFIVYELFIGINRYFKRKYLFKKALQKSKELNKPLIVIGDPKQGTFNFLFGQNYGCGDITIDITGSPVCSNKSLNIRGKIEDILPKIASNSAIIFISCVLEYVDSSQLPQIINNLYRIGGKSGVFIVCVEWYSFTSRLYFSRFITNESPANNIIYLDKNGLISSYKKLKK